MSQLLPAAAQLLMVAYGLGRDSTALLIELFRRGIRPDAITWANTGSERDGTYAYLPIINRWLRSVGFPTVTVVQYDPVRAPYHTIEGNMVLNGTLPGATFNIGSCTAKAKIEPQNKWTRQWDKAQAAWARGEKIVKMIGFEAGEEYRLKRADAKAHSGKDGSADAKKYEYRMPLIEWGYDLNKCIEIIESAGLPVPPKSACYLCLAGETEVITSKGTRSIRELAETGSADLLVPVRNGHYKAGEHGSQQFQSAGMWTRCEVKSFGRQPLLRLVLCRGRARKIVYCTAEHRWINLNGDLVVTSDLKRGDGLKSCRSISLFSSGKPVRPSPFAVAQGFTFGDGTTAQGNRPGTARFFGTKYRDMFRYFAACDRHDEHGVPYVSDLPRSCKRLPDLGESRSFLLGWLAGYFAADGTVRADGRHASLWSSRKAYIQFVRDVCYLLGVQTSKIHHKWRKGANGKYSYMYWVSIEITDLPTSFWLRSHHASRVRGAKKSKERTYDWRVVSLHRTRREEEVFCAVVPGAERFTLADNLLTGNCPNQKEAEVHELSDDERARIILVELSAEPYNKKISGLWRNKRKGDGRPGSITEYILQQGLSFTELTDLGEQIVLNPACAKFKNGGLYTFEGPHNELTLRKQLREAGHAVPEVVLEPIPGKTIYKEDRRVPLEMAEETAIHMDIVESL